MNIYLLEIEKYFVGKTYFKVEAESKADAISKFKPPDDNYKDTLKCIKKLQK